MRQTFEFPYHASQIEPRSALVQGIEISFNPGIHFDLVLHWDATAVFLSRQHASSLARAIVLLGTLLPILKCMLKKVCGRVLGSRNMRDRCLSLLQTGHRWSGEGLYLSVSKTCADEWRGWQRETGATSLLSSVLIVLLTLLLLCKWTMFLTIAIWVPYID